MTKDSNQTLQKNYSRSAIKIPTNNPLSKIVFFISTQYKTPTNKKSQPFS
jgi:hypothetical protein